MKHQIKLSVVMSVFNGETYLRTAIDSILNQTFQEFEFIILNDNSSDKSEEIILSYNDKRIVYVKNEENLGLAASLNKGLKLAKGEFIARMDDDDIAMPSRFEKQVDYLDKYANIGVVGTHAKLIGDKSGVRKHSTQNEELKIKSLFSCQFCHPTVMMRKSVLEENIISYNPSFKTAQDYELWSRLVSLTDFGTIPEQLLEYRFHNKQLSSAKRELQLKNTYQIYNQIVSNLGLELTEDELELHKKLASLNFNIPNTSIEKIGLYLSKLIAANNKEAFFNKEKFATFLSEYFYNICRVTKGSAFKKSRVYANLGFKKYFYRSLLPLRFLMASEKSVGDIKNSK